MRKHLMAVAALTLALHARVEADPSRCDLSPATPPPGTGRTTRGWPAARSPSSRPESRRE